MTDTQDVAISGRVVGVRGSVVDVAFPEGCLPALNDALVVTMADGRTITVEVQQHLDLTTVRSVALETTSGLMRGEPVQATGGAITVPVGEPVLGRLIDVLGHPHDGKPDFAGDVERWPIHRAAPLLKHQSTVREPFMTGIKVIDLLAPLVRGGKAGMFGGAGVGKTVLIMELIRTT
ncbi:MAG: F0F1 ATP synthase subunit beta, partial [Rhodospirillaceae bacterium]